MKPTGTDVTLVARNADADTSPKIGCTDGLCDVTDYSTKGQCEVPTDNDLAEVVDTLQDIIKEVAQTGGDSRKDPEAEEGGSGGGQTRSNRRARRSSGEEREKRRQRRVHRGGSRSKLVVDENSSTSIVCRQGTSEEDRLEEDAIGDGETRKIVKSKRRKRSQKARHPDQRDGDFEQLSTTTGGDSLSVRTGGVTGATGGEETEKKNPLYEMIVAGLIMMAGTGTLLMSVVLGGEVGTIVGSSCMGLGLLLLVIGVCWYLSKTTTEDGGHDEDRIDVRVIDKRHLADLLKRGVQVHEI